jgi:hypothetical protein
MKLVFKFTGGPLDGKTVIGRTGQQDEADRYYTLTNHGRTGQRFRTASPLAIDTLADEELKQERPHRFQEHVYQVTDRHQDAEKVFIRAEYVPRASHHE